MQFKNPEKIQISDQLSAERTKLSNQRTLLSFLRSALYFILTGLAVDNFEIFNHYQYASVLFLVFGLVLVGYGFYNFLTINKAISATRLLED